MRLISVGFAIVVGGALAAGCKTRGAAGSNPDGATTLAAASVKPGPVNELPLPKEQVDKTINPEHLPEYKGPTGVVEGTITVSGDAAPPVMGKSFDKCPAGADFYAKTFREGPPNADGTRPLADAIVGVPPARPDLNQAGYAGFFIPETKPNRLLTITNCVYDSRTVDMTFGQALEVKNLGGSNTPLMAPFLENQPSTAVLLATPGGDPVHLWPKTPGRYRLIDRVGNQWMDADVYVSVTSLHTVTDAKGHYRIEGVPVGKMTVETFHPAISTHDAVKKEITVQDGVVTTVDLTIANEKPAKQPPSHPPRKIF
jgi:carboxypeptidase family protein